jgi:hypothetical protein
MSPQFLRRSLLVAVAAPAVVLALGAPALAGTDPIFGEGCRYVAVDTPTPLQPEVTVCRPW